MVYAMSSSLLLYLGQSKCVSFSDRNAMPYVEAVMLETLRLANVALNALPHKADADLDIDGKVRHTYDS